MIKAIAPEDKEDIMDMRANSLKSTLFTRIVRCIIDSEFTINIHAITLTIG
jgi:hypothetical protein